MNDTGGNPLPHRAGVSAFGLNGVNAHVVLEEYIDKRTQEEKHESEQLIVLSANNETQLKLMVKTLYEFLKEHTEVALTNISYTLQQGREEMPTRLAIVVSNMENLLIAFDNYLQPTKRTCSSVNYMSDTSTKNTETKFLFQGTAGKYFLQELIKTNDLKRLALCWVNGAEIPWNLLNQNKFVKRISLPGYQFCEDNYWPTKKMYQSEISVHNKINNIYKSNSDKLAGDNKLFLKWYD